MASARTSHLPINRERTQPISPAGAGKSMVTLSRAQPQPRHAKANKTPRRPFPALTSSTAPARIRDDPPGSLRPPRRCAKAVRPRPSQPRARPRAGLSGASGASGGNVSGFCPASVHRPRPRYLRPSRAEMPAAAPSRQPRRRRAGATGRPQSHAEPQLGQSGLAPQRPARPLEAGCPHGGSACSNRKVGVSQPALNTAKYPNCGRAEGEDNLSFLRSESRSILHFSRPFLYVHAPTQLNEGFKGKDSFIN